MTHGPFLDTQSLGYATERPGSDPRSWNEHGTVDAIEHDAEHGLIATVTLLPQEVQVHALVGILYGGSGFGLYLPIDVGDDVLVLIPGGDFSNTPVVVSRIWSPARRPPSDLTNEHVVLHVKDGKDCRIKTTGGGRVIIKVEGAGDVLLQVADGKVLLGGDNLLPTDGAVHGAGIDPFTGSTYHALGNTSSVVRLKR